ncbi:MAG: serine/threonine-protein kinase [Acidobacteriota bacterium]
MVSAYRLERALGTGGMGSVFRARHALDERVAALKVLREDQLTQDRAVDRMMREASILATVSHPGIPQLFECGLLADGRPWIAMELVDGKSLSRRLVDGALPAAEVGELIGGIASVLAAAHARGVVHRDLKPENILMTPTDARFPLRVIDWGIALQDAGARYTHHDEAIGTPTYMAPEQARGGATTALCDVYGLGVVAYHALAGRPPFRGKSSVEILVQHLQKPLPELAPRCPDAPPELVALVERMLAKRPEDRPSAEQVRAALVGPAAGCVVAELEEPATLRMRRVAVD